MAEAVRATKSQEKRVSISTQVQVRKRLKKTFGDLFALHVADTIQYGRQML